MFNTEILAFNNHIDPDSNNFYVRIEYVIKGKGQDGIDSPRVKSKEIFHFTREQFYAALMFIYGRVQGVNNTTEICAESVCNVMIKFGEENFVTVFEAITGDMDRDAMDDFVESLANDKEAHFLLNNELYTSLPSDFHKYKHKSSESEDVIRIPVAVEIVSQDWGGDSVEIVLNAADIYAAVK